MQQRQQILKTLSTYDNEGKENTSSIYKNKETVRHGYVSI